MIYKMLLNDLNNNPTKKSLVTQVKYTLQCYGFNHVWIAQGVANEKQFLAMFRQRVKDNYVQTWNGENNASSRNDFYTAFSTFGFKDYLKHVTINKFRHNLTRLRVSSHSLSIETGRWHKPNKTPRNERKCIICDDVEDEFHFLLFCPLYKDIRKKYIKKYFWSRPSMFKFVELMKIENITALRNLSLFITRAIEIRSSAMTYIYI